MISVPDGAYSNNNGDRFINDEDGTAIYNIPSDYTGIGILLTALYVQEIGDTYTILK